MLLSLLTHFLPCRRSSLALAFAATVFCTHRSSAQTALTQDEATRTLVSKTSFLQSLCKEDDLSFSAEGAPTGPCTPHSFTTALLTIDRAELSRSELKLTAHRVGLRFDSDVPSQVDLSHPRHGRKPHKVTLRIPAPANGDYTAALAAIFTTRYADLYVNVPDYWRMYFRKHLLSLDAKPLVPTESEREAAVQQIAKAGEHGVSAPSLLHMKDAYYSDDAKRMLYQAECITSLVVDSSGEPRDLSIAKAVGLELDDRAVEAIRQYKFAPATLNGLPVNVRMNVATNFQIR